MILVSRLSGERVYVNAELIVWVESTPDTVLSFCDGRKLVVRETPDQIRDMVVEFKRRCGGDWLLRSPESAASEG